MKQYVLNILCVFVYVCVCILALFIWQANRIFLRRAVPPVAYLAVGSTVFFHIIL